MSGMQAADVTAANANAAGGGEVLRVSGLRFGYDTRLLFDDLSFAAPAGAIVALIGPNGSGKSTLMKCLTGILRPFAGDIRVAGQSVSEAPTAVRRHMGYLPDDFGLYDRLTARRHLLFAKEAYGCSDDDMQQTAAATGLEELLDKYPGHMSRGQRQRLGIAMSVMHRPPLLLLDEPASGLDPLARAELAALLKRLQSGGATIIVSSHILSELREYAGHYVIMHDGRIKDAGALTGATMWRARPLPETLAAALAFLRADEHAHEVREHDGNVLFHLPPAGDAAALLRRMINAGALLSEFAPAAADIEDIYRARLRGEERLD